MTTPTPPNGEPPCPPSHITRGSPATRLGIALLVGVLALGGLYLFGSQSSKPGTQNKPVHPALANLPADMLWAWERPEDLLWLAPDIGVAFVASVVELAGDGVYRRARSPYLKVRPETALVPVVHVDASWRQSPALNERQQTAIVDAVLAAAHLGNRRVVQLDFEVRLSQRPFLRAVVRQIRQQLPPDFALSVTALASWCAGDYWLADLAADEIVPMAFRMASDDRAIRAMLAESGQFRRPGCQQAIGLASDEPPIHLPSRIPTHLPTHLPTPTAFAKPPVRRYYFSPQSWTESTWQSASHR